MILFKILGSTNPESRGGITWQNAELVVAETAKGYKIDGSESSRKFITKEAVGKIDTKLVNELSGIIGFYTYCLPDAVEATKQAITKAILSHYSDLIVKSMKNVKAISRIIGADIPLVLITVDEYLAFNHMKTLSDMEKTIIYDETGAIIGKCKSIQDGKLLIADNASGTDMPFEISDCYMKTTCIPTYF
jgi:hypothetical protein